MVGKNKTEERKNPENHSEKRENVLLKFCFHLGLVQFFHFTPFQPFFMPFLFELG